MSAHALYFKNKNKNKNQFGNYKRIKKKGELGFWGG
jgi:hypothetical protein